MPLNFVPAIKPARDPSAGDFARLEPLDADRHGDDLWKAVADADEIWRYMAYGPFFDRGSFDRWLASRSSLVDPVTFTVIDGVTRRAGGLLALMEIRPANGVIEIGNILLAPALQKTRVATEAFHLAASRVFALGYRRLEWKCDDRNAASKRAALRFGFKPEGLFRQHMIVKGDNRDTAWFAILDHEWPRLNAGFRTWLASENFDAEGRQNRRLSECLDD